MKKYFLGLILFSAFVGLSSCGLFKEKCNCPHFEMKNEKFKFFDFSNGVMTSEKSNVCSIDNKYDFDFGEVAHLYKIKRDKRSTSPKS